MRSGVSGHLGDLAGVDAKPAGALSAGELDRAFEEGRPHVELDLLRQTEAVVQELGQPVAAPRPGLDLELEQLSVRCAELDLPSLQMACERDESERAWRRAGHPHRSIPRPWHSHHELVVHAHDPLVTAELLKGGELARRGAIRIGHQTLNQSLRGYGGALYANAVAPMEMWTGSGAHPLHIVALYGVVEGRGSVIGPGALNLVAVQRSRPPEIPPGREGHAHRPAGGGGQSAGERRAAHDVAAYPRDRRVSRCDAQQTTSPPRPAWLLSPRDLARDGLALRDALDPR